MNYGQASGVKEALEKALKEEKVREIFFIRVYDGEVQIYEDFEELPEIEKMKDKGLYL